MNSQNTNGWPTALGPGRSPPHNEQAAMQQRPPGNFGPAVPLQQGQQPQMNTPSHIPQSTPSYFSNQPNGHNIPNHAPLQPQASPMQASPMQSARVPPAAQQQQHSPTTVQQPGAQSAYGLPTSIVSHVGQASQTSLNAERELLERERELAREQQIQQQIARQRYDQEAELLNQQREQQQREQQVRDQTREQRHSPHENHTGAIPIQQPVASRMVSTLHGPNGILNDQHLAAASAAPPSQPTMPLGAPSGPGNVFANGIQTNDNVVRPFAQQVAQNMPPQQLLGFGTPATPQQLSTGVAALSQGQQPILNDALSYLDQVKVRFAEQPDVYNRFLDIMKDFKSQAIDTPGVIDRVSSLFAGHPELIQGFNTFLPPGYRIECGTQEDPNAIRVTTPMGTTVSQMPSAQNRLNGGPNSVTSLENGRPTFYGDRQLNGEWLPQSHEPENPESLLYPGGRQGALGIFAGQPHMGNEVGVAYEEQNVSQISPNAAQMASLNQAAPGLPPNAQQQLFGLEKRGPVEFNHAIGYVNKIKTRFASQPEIYKQFLEILQTYQRESKPIQDVYAQVTQLFSSATDLLEDFKQFLPESAAQAKAQAQQAAQKQATEDAAMLSNVRGDSSYGAGVLQNQVHTPREIKMPPVGNFAPPSVGKENKKRRGGPGSQITGGAAALDSGIGASSQNRARGGGGNTKQRGRIEPVKPVPQETAPISPTLIPSLPTPMPPTRDPAGSSEAMTFFERIKKFIANKQTYNDFLKLCNLFTQEIIDKNDLMHKAGGFIGSNNELMNWFKRFVQYDGRDEIFENRPQIPGDKVVLSNCRGLGPSYRLLPKRERLRTCSGRDEMCQMVLNDEWVSHPTWASEESGFIAHRKNTFEEALHRIEEERHDYDINIEACLRTIQLLEPIAQQFKMMSEEERLSYVLPPGIGGQSETIYQRIIKKIYDRERGCKVIEDMFRRPSAVVPIVLGRLRQKAEEWKASQREWEKVWREQTNRVFWKSLDHQGISVKTADKRQFQPKVLQTEIQVRYDEQRRQRIVPWNTVPNYQFKYIFDDLDVVQDACHLILTQLHHAYVGNEVDKSRLETFIKTFIPTFFDIDRDAFDMRMTDIYDTSPPNEEMEEEASADADSTLVRNRRAPNGKKSNLLRGVLDRAKQNQKEDSVLESKETTPDVQSNDEDTQASTGTPTEQPRVDPSEHRWMTHPSTGSNTVDLNVPFKREDFHLYASLNIYCFFRMFEMLYTRLSNLKANENKVHDDVRRSAIFKAASELRLIDKTPVDFFGDVSATASYYAQVMQMCEEVVKQELESAHLEETLRRFYMQNGWQLYSFDKMLAAILRFALQILVSDNKDKSLDIINLFYKDRKEDETTHQAELTYRKQVEKLTKEGDIYRIRYTRSTKTAMLQIFKKDDKTYEADELATQARWSYYVSAFSMFDRTEGIDMAKIRLPYLHRNMPSKLENAEDYDSMYAPVAHEDGLVIRISPNNYHILYDPYSNDWWVQSVSVRKRGLSGYDEVKAARKKGLVDLYENREKNEWMKGMGDAMIESTKEAFSSWIKNGPPDAAVNGIERHNGGINGVHDGDEVMGGI